MRNNLLIYLAPVLVLLSCNSQSEKGHVSINEKEYLQLLVIETEEEIYQNQGTYVKMYLNDENGNILKGYLNCPVTKSSDIDTIAEEVKNCHQRLSVKQDTVLIYIEPNSLGKYHFPKFTILGKSGQNYFTLDTVISINILPPSR